MTDPQDHNARNRRLAFWAVGVPVMVMLGLTAISVPLYRLFCAKTGYDGTVTAGTLPATPTSRRVTIHFNADTAHGFAWDFKPEQKTMVINAGQKALAAFHAHNRSDHELSGSALYNVTPYKVGQYFHKIQCFCFSKQTLEAGQSVDMPVVFFVDPAFATDINMRDVTDITLSYTFYPADTQALERATEDFYNQPSAKPSAAGKSQE